MSIGGIGKLGSEGKHEEHDVRSFLAQPRLEGGTVLKAGCCVEVGIAPPRREHKAAGGQALWMAVMVRLTHGVCYRWRWHGH